MDSVEHVNSVVLTILRTFMLSLSVLNFIECLSNNNMKELVSTLFQQLRSYTMQLHPYVYFLVFAYVSVYTELVCFYVNFCFSYEQRLLTVFVPFEKAYLSKSLTRVFDAVNQLFVSPGKSLPGRTELIPLTKTFLRYELTETSYIHTVQT